MEILRSVRGLQQREYSARITASPLQAWFIEIFFCQFKHLLGCRHLLSHNQHSIEIQAYSVIITRLVIALWTVR